MNNILIYNTNKNRLKKLLQKYKVKDIKMMNVILDG
jgi:hypothetical protein